jgi:hypothetical protein
VVTAQAALAAAATLVAVAFTFCTLDRWLSRRRRHDLAWTVALGMFAIASGALWLGSSVGFTGPTFRVFFLFGAILNVPYLALGTVYLFAGQRNGDRVALGLTCAAFFAAGVMVVAPLKAPISGTDLPTGSEVFGPLPRVLAAAVGSAGGALVVFGGAVLSLWRVVGGRERTRGRGLAAHPKRLAIGNALIAAGTLILGASGLLNGRLGASKAFAVTLTICVTVLFAGFLVATSSPRRPDTAAGTESVRSSASASAERVSKDLPSPALG